VRTFFITPIFDGAIGGMAPICVTDGQDSTTSLTAALWTRCRDDRVDAGRLERIELQ